MECYILAFKYDQKIYSPFFSRGLSRVCNDFPRSFIEQSNTGDTIVMIDLCNSDPFWVMKS